MTLGARLRLFALLTAIAGAAAPAHAATSKIFGGWAPRLDNDLVLFQRNYNLFNDIALYYYGVDSAGNVNGSGGEHVGMIAWAQAHGVKVYGTVGGAPPALPAGYTGAAGTNNINQIVALCNTYGYDGFDIDYEGLSGGGGARANMTTFVTNLATALHAMVPRRDLIMTIPPYVNSANEAASAYDYAAIAAQADRVQVMIYDYSWATAGPIAPRAWHNSVMTFALTRIPAAKFVVAVPWYGRDWNTTDATINCTKNYTTYGERSVITGCPGVKELIATYGAVPTLDAPSGEYWFNYTAAGKNHTVWYNDASTFAWRCDDVITAGAAGVYPWDLTFPDSDPDGLTNGVWDVVRTKFSGPAAPLSDPDIVFDSFESGALAAPATNQGVGGTIAWTNQPAPANKNGLRGGRLVYNSGTGWGVWVRENSPLGASINASTANQWGFWANIPAGVQFFMMLEEGTLSGGDGEVWSSTQMNGTGAWEYYLLPLATHTQYIWIGNQTGNKVMDLVDMKSWYLQINGSQGSGTAYVDDLHFTLIWGSGSPTPTPTRTRSPTPSATVTPSATPTPTRTITTSSTATRSITPSVSPSITPTITPSRTGTQSITPSVTPSATRTATPSSTVTPSMTPSATTSATPTATGTPTLTTTPTITLTFSASPTLAGTLTDTPTSTATPTISATFTPTGSPSTTPSQTPSVTPSSSATPSSTITPAASFTSTLTNTPTATATLSSTFTATATPSSTATSSATPSPSSSATPTATPTSSVTSPLTPTTTSTVSATATATLSNSPTHSVTETSTPGPAFTATSSATPTPSSSSSSTPGAALPATAAPTAVPAGGPAIISVAVVPNPAPGTAAILAALLGQPATSLDVEIYTAAFTKVLSQRYPGSHNPGWNHLVVDLSSLPDGLYHLRVRSSAGGKAALARLFKIK